MMMKTLLTATLVGMLALSVSACAQSTPQNYKPHLSVLAKELTPSETPIDLFTLQGSWRGAGTLLRDVGALRVSDRCSSTFRLAWEVNGSSIEGSHHNRNNVRGSYEASIDPNGRWSGVTTSASGHRRPIAGWFAEDRAVGFMRVGNSRRYCDFRLDLRPAE